MSWMIRLIECGIDDCLGKIGIHLLNPSQDEIDDAVSVAERDMFPAIYIHRQLKLDGPVVLDTVTILDDMED